jgi:hypothetical protein
MSLYHWPKTARFAPSPFHVKALPMSPSKPSFRALILLAVSIVAFSPGRACPGGKLDEAFTFR